MVDKKEVRRSHKSSVDRYEHIALLGISIGMKGPQVQYPATVSSFGRGIISTERVGHVQPSDGGRTVQKVKLRRATPLHWRHSASRSQPIILKIKAYNLKLSRFMWSRYCNCYIIVDGTKTSTKGLKDSFCKPRFLFIRELLVTQPGQPPGGSVTASLQTSLALHR